MMTRIRERPVIRTVRVVAMTERLARGLGALGVLTGLVAGLPWALWHAVGWPLPHHVPTWQQVQAVLNRPMDDQFLLNLLTCTAWVLWAAFVAETAVTTTIAVDDLRHGRATASRSPGAMPRLSGLGWRRSQGRALGRLTAALVSAIILAVAASRDVPVRLTDMPAAVPVAAAGATVTSDRPSPASPPAGDHQPSATASPSRTQPRWRHYTVARPHDGIHDSLWRIADRELGDPRRWVDIYRLNAGRRQPDGARLRDPDLIYPGWILRLPVARLAPDTSTPREDPEDAAAPGEHIPRVTQTDPATATPSPAPTPAPAPAPATTEPSTTSATGTTAAPASRSATPALSPSRHAAPPDPGIDLPSGGYVGLALATSVLASLAMARARRRRRDRLDGPLTFRLPLAPATETTEQPSPLVEALRQAHHNTTLTRPSPDNPLLDDETEEKTVDGVIPLDDAPAERPAPLDSPDAGDPGNSRMLTLGTHHGHQVNADLAALGSLGLTGPGSDAAARAILVALLASPPQDPQALETAVTGRSRLLVPRADLDRLLGTPPDGVPGLHVVPDLDSALDLIETEAVTAVRNHTARSLDTTGATASPSSLVTLIATPTPQALQRLEMLLTGQASPGLAAILLDDSQTPGLALHVAGLALHLACQSVVTDVTTGQPAATIDAATGAGTAAHRSPDRRPAPGDLVLPHDAQLVRGARLFHLNAAEARDILTQLPDDAVLSDNPVLSDDAASLPQDPEPTDGTDDAVTTIDPPSPTLPAQTATPRTSTIPTARERPWTAPVRIDLLGAPSLTVNGQEVGRGVRAKTFELLAILVLHPDGATGESIGDALWPDQNTDAARTCLHGALKRLRVMLRTHTGASQAMFVINASHRYRLDPRLIDSDIWAFQTACHRAETAPDADGRLAALRQASNLYRGPLLDGAAYPWAEPDRVALHRLGLQVLVRLAAAIADDDPEAALSALERALVIDPYNESLYRRTMRLQARLQRPEAISGTLALLRHHLADLDTEPEPATLTLADALRR
jgi:DNA-binding SARP family transcriptional activator